MKVLIVGAGVAGLAIGWRLAQAGIAVEILERGLAGRGATWASAGMIAPGAEIGERSSAIAQYARNARAKWPRFAAELEAASGQCISYRESGSLLTAESAERARVLETQAPKLAQEGVAAAWLFADALRAREPLLSPDLLGALHIADDAQVDNRALGDGLRIAAAKAGAAIRELCEVRSLVVHEGRALAVLTADGTHHEADRIVLACGAWMNLIGGTGPEILPPVRPVKGQMVACEPPAGTALPQALIWGEGVYLVPRGGRLFIGATVEHASFDTSVSCEARDWLLGAAARLIPSLVQWRVAEMWAGLRPHTPDDAPVLGATATSGLFVASGQFRNGILFAPAVGDTLRDVILEQASPPGLDAFDPRRFAAS
jgi:glycine oxidase